MYNDYELLYLAQENNEDAVNELRKKYNSLLYAKALSYSRSSHIDIKELLNEINDFNENQVNHALSIF